MTFSDRPKPDRFTQVPNPPLVRDGGVPYAPLPQRDPFVAWIELMEVVEALCLRWPRRAVGSSGQFRL